MHVERQMNAYDHNNDDHYMVQHNKVLKCICQTCTCGKHHCPKRPIKTDFQTSYSRQFKKFNPMPAGQRPAYRYEERHYSPQVMKSNYQENYQKQIEFEQQKPISNSRFEDVGRAIMAPPVPFMGVSSYKEQYQGYKMAKNVEAQNPELQYPSPVNIYNQNIKNKVKFQGISSYKSQFLPIQNKRNDYRLPEYKKPDVPFYGSSSYKDQYKPFIIQPHQQVFESRVYRNTPNVKFQGKSAYKDSFQPYEIRPLKSYDYNNIPKTQCKLDQMVLPSINYINNKNHVYIDPQNKKFY